MTLPPPPRNRPDPLVEWLKTNKNVLALDEEAAVGLVTRVTEQGYAGDLTDEKIAKIGRDPFLAAYALADIQQRCVIPTEHSRPSRSRASRKLPDESRDLNVRCINTFALIQELDFRTDWSTILRSSPRTPSRSMTSPPSGRDRRGGRDNRSRARTPRCRGRPPHRLRPPSPRELG